MESSSDAVSLRVAAGLLGLLLLGGYYLAKRRGWSHGVLPDGFTPTIAVTVFGMAGLGLAWLAAVNGGGLVAVRGITGPGWYLSGAIVALAMAAGYGLKLAAHAGPARPPLTAAANRPGRRAGGWSARPSPRWAGTRWPGAKRRG